MLTADFDYDLPADRIAQEPVGRGESRLFCVDQDADRRRQTIRNLPSVLRPGDLLVLNDTRVIPARLFGQAPTGGKIELLLIEKVDESSGTEWTCLTKPAKRTRPGANILFEDDLEAMVTEKLDAGKHRVRFSHPVEEHLERLGHVPLPPYIKRTKDADGDRPEDRARYQTIYAREPGAIAAPTAGLHFDQALLEQLKRSGIEIAKLTLHVGIGTFKPVTVDLVHEHQMDSERYEISEQTAQQIESARRDDRRIVAVGTTVVRTLESVAQANQGTILPGRGRTELFITPGYEFQIVDALLTNFHLPRSTLLMLVCAFAGKKRVLEAYQEAIREGYRFYSYGDAMFVERGGKGTLLAD